MFCEFIKVSLQKGKQMSSATIHEPEPVKNASRPVWEVVIEDMHARDNMGRAKYGFSLQAHNGRNALWDAYQEALDLVVYLRQKIIEEEEKGVNI
jgi:hypothetical protein